jgi:hypothetical protein
LFSVIVAPPTFPDVQVGAAYPPTGKAFARTGSFRVRISWELEPTTYRARFAPGAIHLAPVPAGWTTRAAEAG